jgi:hypothetical protein
MLFLHDAAQAGAVLGAIALAAVCAPLLRIDRRIWPAALVVALAAACVPQVLASTWGTDLRLPLVAVLLLLGGVSLRPVSTARRAAALAGVIALVSAKSVDAWIVLRRLDGQIAETRRVIAVLPVGARLLVVNTLAGNTGQEQVSASTFWHMALTATIDRDAFLPTLFTGLSTVHVRDAYRDSSTPNGLPITPAQLWQGAAESGPAGGDFGNGLGARFYHFGWPDKFDYVLVQHFGQDPGRLPPTLQLVAAAPDMSLYRVHKD